VSIFDIESQVTITWDIPLVQEIGTYRIQYFGNWKEIGGSITSFTGKSSQFKVTSRKSYYKKKYQKLTNVICFYHDIHTAENYSLGVKQQSLTH
jgi:hypothetical protein